MSEAALRLVLTGGVGAAAVAVAAAAARVRSARAAAAPLDLDGLEGRVLLFTEGSCPSCRVAKERLDAAGAAYVEIPFEEMPDAHRAAGVTAVPLVVVRRPDGVVVGRIAGKPGRRALERLLGRAGAK